MIDLWWVYTMLIEKAIITKICYIDIYSTMWWGNVVCYKGKYSTLVCCIQDSKWWEGDGQDKCVGCLWDKSLCTLADLTV